MAVSGNDGVSASWSLNIFNDSKAFSGFEQWFTSMAEEAQLSKRNSYDLRLFFDEALGNIMEYGFDTGFASTVELSVECDEHCINVEIADDGKPFDPTAAMTRETPQSPEEVTVGGWGIELMRNISEELAYERSAGRNRLRMRMRRQLSE